jgi:hypothetical protein
MRLTAIRETLTERDFDVVRTMSYRPELFGRPFSAALQRVMRGPSDWSVGERELFAAFVSCQNQCPF